MKASSGVAPEVLPLPQGGGGVRSIGETFSPDLFTGTGSYAVPLWFPPGPGGFQPRLRLTYTTARGQGPFGMGWDLPTMRIARRTDRGLPAYDTADELLLDGETLVTMGDGTLRKRHEGSFHRVERSGDGWEVRDRGGRRYLLGLSPGSRIEDTAGPVTRTFAWLVERAIDTRGNEIHYRWRRDGGQLYLESIAYGPYEVRFAYEERDDALVDRRAGFPIRTALRCAAIEYHLAGEPDPRFRRYSLTYDVAPHSHLSLLSAVTLSGERTVAGVPQSVELPRVSFAYSDRGAGRHYRPFEATAGRGPTEPLSEPGLALVDMNAEALPGVLEVDGPVRRFWPNRGGGRWGAPRTVDRLPASLDLASPAVALADIDGDGTADLLLLDEPPLGYVPNRAGEGWKARTRFRRAPSFEPSDPELRLVDLDGDGRVDAIRSGTLAFEVHLNRGADGWSPPSTVPRVRDLDAFPDVSFSDPRVRFADMTGDGLADVVRVHGSRVDYWASLGRGRFGSRIGLDLSPSLAFGFDPERLFLVDVDGDGLTDVVYVERHRVRIWINRAGTSLHHAGDVRHTPAADGTNVLVADMDGTGTQGLLWSYAASHPGDRNYKYLAFRGAIRPHLLTRIDNGLGLTTEISYDSSADELAAARERGEPWARHLPFPVQLVTRIEERDALSGAHTTRTIRYHDGFFDGVRREFLGFGRVQVTEHGDAEAMTSRTTSWFHQGDSGLGAGATREERRSLRGRLHRIEVHELAAGQDAPRLLRRELDDYLVRTLGEGVDGEPILFAHLAGTRVEMLEGAAAGPTLITTLDYDDFGNVVEKRERWTSGATPRERIGRFTYTADAVRWILNLPVEHSERDGAGTLLRLKRFFYDGPDMVGLPAGQVERGDLVRTEDLVLTDAAVAAVFGPLAPDLAAHGFHRTALPGGGEGWATHGVRQRHDARGNVVERSDALGNAGTLEYEPFGIAPVAATDPAGHRYEGEYDLRAAALARLRDPNGHETRYRFDAAGRLIALIKPGDDEVFPTQVFEYLDGVLPLGRRSRLRQQPGAAATLDSLELVDGRGETLQLRSEAEDGRTLVDAWRRYDARGWEAERTTPFFSAGGLVHVPGEGAGHPQRYRFVHDGLGRVIEAHTPDGNVSRTLYGPGQVTRFDVTDTDPSPANLASGHFATPRDEHYDAQGRLTRLVERNVGDVETETRYVWDELGQLAAVVDARGVETVRYTYDGLGRKIRVDHVDAGVRRSLYDARGDLARQWDAAERIVEIRYDASRRRSEVRVDGAVEERYSYDVGAGANLLGRLAEVEDAGGRVELSYTPRGLLQSKARTMTTAAGSETFRIGYAYDSMERMTRVVRPDASRIDYTYDDRGLTASVPGVVDLVRRNALGQVLERRFSNGVIETQTIDPDSFYATELRVDGPARPEPYHHVRYAYDAAGNPLSATDLVAAPGHVGFSREFTYDALSQLTGVSGTRDGTPFAHAYHYDEVGNFARNEERGPEDLVLEPGGTNRILGTTSGGVTTPLYGYDVGGHQTAAPGRTCEFDARGRLTRVVRDDGTRVEMTYGYDGARVRKRTLPPAGPPRESLYVEGVFERHAGEVVLYVFIDGQRVAVETAAAGRHYLHGDRLGSIVLVTDDAGAIVREIGYLPFGTVAFAGGAATPSGRGYAGCEHDAETGLVYCGARFYDPRQGRFLSPDPYVLFNPERSLRLPANLNLYVYAGNNPMRQVDDEGTFWKWIVGALIIVALVVATVVVGVFTGGAGFAFGIMLAATLGSAIGAGVGVASAAAAGGSEDDLANGFLFGAIVGGAAGAAGYAAGAAVGAAGISGVWGSILSGAAQGAVIGAGNGAIIGYAGGKGDFESIMLQMGIGFLAGAVLGGLAGWLSFDPGAAGQAVEKSLSTGPAVITDSLSGAPVPAGYSTGLQPIGQAAGNATTQIVSVVAHPIHFTAIGAAAQFAVTYYWDDIKAQLIEWFGGEEERVIVGG